MRIEEVEGDRIDIRPEIQGGPYRKKLIFHLFLGVEIWYLKKRLYYIYHYYKDLTSLQNL